MIQLPDPNLPWPIVMAGVAMIAEREQGPGGGCALKAYRCPAGIFTIAWGKTGPGVGPASTCTKAQADGWLCDDLTELSLQVLAMCARPPTANELAALCSLAYNIGPAALRGSTVMRLHNAGNAAGAARAFGAWNKAHVNGMPQELPGLTARRAAEAALYLAPDADAAPQPGPQAVAPEQQPLQSRRVAAGTAATGAGALGLLSQAGDAIQPVHDAAESARSLLDALGVPAHVLPWALLAGIGLFLVWHFFDQRANGQV